MADKISLQQDNSALQLEPCNTMYKHSNANVQNSYCQLYILQSRTKFRLHVLYVPNQTKLLQVTWNSLALLQATVIHTTTPFTLIAPLLILKLRDSTVWKLPDSLHLHIRQFTAIQSTQRKQAKNHLHVKLIHFSHSSFYH